jgi:hypothetical protein
MPKEQLAQAAEAAKGKVEKATEKVQNAVSK